MNSRTAYLQSDLPGLSCKRGKVRDIYDFGEHLLIIASDRISAFDWVMPNGIPDKGRVLTQVSEMWFRELSVKNHLISNDPTMLDIPEESDLESLRGRSMVVRKTEVVPIECVVRGYLAGSGWREYQQSGTVCEIALPDGLLQSTQLPEPIFTPATKADEGHDENISFDQMVDAVGAETAEQLRAMSLEIYSHAARYAAERGVILADTKFEFGRVDGELILIDEVLTPDSSRYWPADQYAPGQSSILL